MYSPCSVISTRIVKKSTDASICIPSNASYTDHFYNINATAWDMDYESFRIIGIIKNICSPLEIQTFDWLTQFVRIWITWKFDQIKSVLLSHAQGPIERPMSISRQNANVKTPTLNTPIQKLLFQLQNPKTQKSVVFHTLTFCLWHSDRIFPLFSAGVEDSNLG